MLNPAMAVQDVQNVQDLLLMTVKQVRALHATLSALMTDVAAMRRTLLLKPDDLALYKYNLSTAIETAKPIVDEALESYDEVIRQIEDSERWRN